MGEEDRDTSGGKRHFIGIVEDSQYADKSRIDYSIEVFHFSYFVYMMCMFCVTKESDRFMHYPNNFPISNIIRPVFHYLYLSSAKPIYV